MKDVYTWTDLPELSQADIEAGTAIRCEDCETIEVKEDAQYIEFPGYFVCHDCINNYSQCERCEVYDSEIINGLCEQCRGDL